MHRRKFLTASTAGLAAALADEKPKRAGLIGCGWYGKCDLFRLIQVAPVEVVSLCDVDKRMLAQAAEMVSTRQASKKTPRAYGDYREMPSEKDLDIVLVATPDHWHALAMIAAVQSGADVYVQKPISVDIVEAQAMLAAAANTSASCRSACSAGVLSPHARQRESARHCAAGLFGLRNVDRPSAHAPLLRAHPSRPLALVMEYGNGIMGDMGIHMYDMVRWMLNLGWPASVSSTGGI